MCNNKEVIFLWIKSEGNQPTDVEAMNFFVFFFHFQNLTQGLSGIGSSRRAFCLLRKTCDGPRFPLEAPVIPILHGDRFALNAFGSLDLLYFWIINAFGSLELPQFFFAGMGLALIKIQLFRAKPMTNKPCSLLKFGHRGGMGFADFV